MEFDRNLSRRQLLVGGGLSVAGGIAGTALFAPRWLPASLTETLTDLYPTPSTVVWEPSISQTHADRALAYFETMVSKAKTLQKRATAGNRSITASLRFELDNTPAGGWLESAKKAEEPRKRLSAVNHGLPEVGRTIGAAKLVLGTVSPEQLAARGEQLRSAATRLHDRHSSYPVHEPARDLGYLWYLEREITWTRSAASVNPETDNEDNRIGAITGAWSSILSATQSLRTARYYRQQYVTQREPPTRSYEPVLTAVSERLQTDLAEFPTSIEKQDALRERTDDSTESVPAAARWILYQLCYNDTVGVETDRHRLAHTVERVVGLAQGLLARRAYQSVLQSLGVNADDSGFDAGRALRAKRSAVRTAHTIRSKYESPLARLLQRAAVRRLGIDVGDLRGGYSDSRPPWYARLRAACAYLVCERMLQDIWEYLDMLLRDDGRTPNSTVTPTRSPSFGGLF